MKNDAYRIATMGLRTGLVLLAVAWFQGCLSGDGKGVDASGNPLGSAAATCRDPAFPAGDAAAEALYTQLRGEIFTSICTQCHLSGAGIPSFQGDGLCDAIGLSSERYPGETLIVPGDPDASLIVKKVEGNLGSGLGGRMPLGGAPLSDVQIQKIGEFISILQ